MTTNAFRVKIPIPNTNDHKELIFRHRQQIFNLLHISETTFYSIMNNKMKFSRPDTKHLRGITIEKALVDVDALEVPPIDMENPDDNQKRNDFLNAIIQKVNA